MISTRGVTKCVRAVHFEHHMSTKDKEYTVNAAKIVF